MLLLYSLGYIYDHKPVSFLVYLMPLDDLDDLLASELGSISDTKRRRDQEAQILSRVQQACPPEEKSVQAAVVNAPNTTTNTDEDLAPVYRYVKALWPVVNTLSDIFTGKANADVITTLPNLRSQLAEQLFSLPDIPNFNKASLFATIATCLDVATKENTEARRIAHERLSRLAQSLALIQQEAERLRAKTLADFVDTLS